MAISQEYYKNLNSKSCNIDLVSPILYLKQIILDMIKFSTTQQNFQVKFNIGFDLQKESFERKERGKEREGLFPLVWAQV